MNITEVPIPKNIVKHNDIYLFKEEIQDKPLFFRISVSFNFNSTACIATDSEGDDHNHGLTSQDIEKLEARFPNLFVNKGRVFLDSEDYCDEKAMLWKIAGDQYSKYHNLVAKGTYHQNQLYQVWLTLSDPDSLKEDIIKVFTEQFGEQIQKYIEFYQLCK